MDIELKPCPFCGKKVQFSYDVELEPSGILCMNCHIQIKFMRIAVKPGEQFGVAMGKMADVWNRRANNADN